MILRKANSSDIEFLWYLRNQPDVYKYARNAEPVLWQEHINWLFPILLGQAPKTLFVIESSGSRAGQIRFDYQDESCEVSISLLKAFRGKGIAKQALSLAIEDIRKQGKIKQIRAEVHKDNIASIKFFEKQGFKFQEKKEPCWLKYTLNL